METESMQDFEIVTRHIVMERHLNAFGNVFGGTMLAWLDEGAALFVLEAIGYANFVTVSMDDVEFRAPAHRGDAVVIYCRVLRTGKSSITVQTRALVHEPGTDKRRVVITCKLSFVCLRDDKPFAYFQTPTYEAWLKKTGRAP